MEFWKMNGAGNDFIIINNMKECLPESSFPALAAGLCERHMSIGADGFMVVERSEKADYKMCFFNSDGSEGEMCGNGARCICRYGYENGLSGQIQRVETASGIVTGYRLDERNYRIRLNDPTRLELDWKIEIDGLSYECAYVELGSPGLPHAVVAIDGLESYDEGRLRELGRAFRHHPAFPKGANVNFYDCLDEGWVLIKTYERGVEDFTYACGTGTGSTALVLMRKGKLSCGEMKARMRGGELSVTIDEHDGQIENVWLTGPTNIVAQGRVTDEEISCI